VKYFFSATVQGNFDPKLLPQKMKRILTTIFVFVCTALYSVSAQILIQGRVTDKNGHPLAGTNIIVKGTYEGTSTDSTGNYRLAVSDENSILVASYVGYAEQEIPVSELMKTGFINFVLNESETQIEGVVITAGTFETADRRRSVTLQPLDILTTPSAAGDIYGALTSFPGAAVIGEDGRLFVRGGDGYETKTFIDGLLSKKPYSSSIPDMPSRGRFNPSLFSGTTFSTGGYSAEYGQALSSALILTSNAMPPKTQTDISLMSVGGGVTQTLKGKNSSVAIGVEYMNLRPYTKLVETRYNESHPFESVGLTLVARQKVGDNGMIKLYNVYSQSDYGVEYPEFTLPGSMTIVSLKNWNNYTNLTYSGDLGKEWFLKSGLALTFDNDNLSMQAFRVDEATDNVQAKITLRKKFNENASLLFGIEETSNQYGQNYAEVATTFTYTNQFDDFCTAFFVETDYRPIPLIAFRAGIRSEHSSVIGENNLGLRLSAALKLTNHTQFSLAYGNFFQTPEEELLRFTHQLHYEQANHYIANIQWEQDNRILRVEAYHKDYSKLVVYNPVEFWNGSYYHNSGKGNSNGIDVFYRDKETFKTVEFWVSYSYVNSKRIYRDYPKMATPPFAPKHSASLVMKKWIPQITTQVGMSVSLASGRPYNNPNSQNFMNELTPFYNDVSINCSYLTSFFDKATIIYSSVSNLLGRDNIFGYRYYSQPNSDGVYESVPVKADSKRFYLLVILITI